jgi:transcription elongation factor Elf1
MGLVVPTGATRRFDCPECGGGNTLSVTVSAGTRLWNCYKAGCGVKGTTSSELSFKDIGTLLNGYSDTPDACVDSIDWSRFTGINEKPVALKELMRYPAAYQAWQQGLVELKYDPKENRLVFVYGTVDSGIGAAGRALTYAIKPKWKRYDKLPIPAIYGRLGGLGCIVEDAISAAAVASTGYTGIALLGTSLHSGFTAWGTKFDKIIVALDEDATIKASRMVQLIEFWKPAVLLPLKRDLKYLTKEAILALIHDRTN